MSNSLSISFCLISIANPPPQTVPASDYILLSFQPSKLIPPSTQPNFQVNQAYFHIQPQPSFEPWASRLENGPYITVYPCLPSLTYFYTSTAALTGTDHYDIRYIYNLRRRSTEVSEATAPYPHCAKSKTG